MPVSGVATPDGTDPTQATNVEYLQTQLSHMMYRFGDVTTLGDINIDTGESVLRDVRILLDAPKLILNTQDEENAELCGIATPDGTDPTQAANVEFVKKARNMQLLFDHTITESETSVWSYRVTLPFPIDKYYIYIEYPANLDTSHQFALKGADAKNTGTNLSAFRGEKLGGDTTQWDAEFSRFHDYLYNCSWQPAYIALNLGNIVAFDVIDEQHFVEGTKIQIWGRDAI